MDKSTRYYNKAMDNYHKGNLDRAIDICELSISESLKNKAAISLKGLLFYLKGDLESATYLWKMNCEVNRDAVSKKYLHGSAGDEERLKLFTEAVKLFNSQSINEALKILNQCEKSDFNYINVNNYISECLIKKGEYAAAKEKINCVLTVDRKNETALKNVKLLKSMGIAGHEGNFNIILAVLVFLCILGGTLTLYNQIYRNKASVHPKVTDIKTKAGESKILPSAVPTPAQPVFPSDIIKGDMKSGNFDSLYSEVIEWKDKESADDDKYLISTAEELLKNEGMGYFYNKGYEQLKVNKYGEAKDEFLKAYSISKGENVIYFLANSCEKSGDIGNAEKYYTEYDSSFPRGSYEETVIYNLCMIYSKTNKEKAKEYAQKLVKNFPNSIYNNSNVKQMLNY